ncbi:hypothetical protein AXF42_Ash013898 [Apostasia shenzhenica]|uniref:Calmodulin-binding protein 60 D n=1 Tax=Apostasia shenzhenica TaxID=1088818 RepID=A0A2I0AS77_9ASPA|nr:hypothetical protein AXF42_Ash013898 [Apostasia shenzhenica]
MVRKRVLGQEEETVEQGDMPSAPEAKRPRPVLMAMREIMGAQCIQRNLSKLEPFLRRVVQEEVQNALHHYVHSAPSLISNQSQHSIRQYELCFHNAFPHTIYTGSRIEAEGGVTIQVTIVDTDSKLLVTSGPLASSKIEILVLDGDFGSETEWSEKDFSDNIVRERDGKRPLLTGELIITLCDGVGYITDATFTDNSSWIRSRKFRLGARISPSRMTTGRVQEAISEAFLVKDHRGESYKKHHPPSLHDEVWRLEKIGKDGAFHRRLAENEIHTVQDFLRNLVMDPTTLRSLLGNGMSNKIWEATLEHARECVPDNKLYSYCRAPGFVLIFTSIYQLVGAIIDHIYHPISELTASQKVIVNKMTEFAYKNHNQIAELKLPLDTLPKPLPAVDAAISLPVLSWSEPQIPGAPSTRQDEPTTQQLGCLFQQPQPHITPGNGLLEDLTQPVQRVSPYHDNIFDNGREFFDMHFGDGQPGYKPPEFDLLGSSPMPLLWDRGSAMCSLDSSLGVSDASQVPNTSARILSSRWVKLIAVLKWMAISRQLSARRAAMAAKRPRIMEMGYPALTTASMYCDATTAGW